MRARVLRGSTPRSWRPANGRRRRRTRDEAPARLQPRLLLPLPLKLIHPPYARPHCTQHGLCKLEADSEGASVQCAKRSYRRPTAYQPAP